MAQREICPLEEEPRRALPAPACPTCHCVEPDRVGRLRALSPLPVEGEADVAAPVRPPRAFPSGPRLVSWGRVWRPLSPVCTSMSMRSGTVRRRGPDRGGAERPMTPRVWHHAAAPGLAPLPRLRVYTGAPGWVICRICRAIQKRHDLDPARLSALWCVTSLLARNTRRSENGDGS